jgi:hypothetical protein
MSVATMQTMALRTDAAKKNDKASLDTQLGAVAAYIPSEVLAAYTTALGVTATVSDKGVVKWALYFGTVVLVAAYVALKYAGDRKVAKAKKAADPSAKIPPVAPQIWVVVLALVAFTAYVMALPGSPFGGNGVNIVGGLLVIAFAVLLPLVGKLVGVTPEPST